MDRRPFWLTVALALLVTSCGMDAGSFTIKFSWDEPPTDTVYMWLRVEERTEPTVQGNILASVGPLQYNHDEAFQVALDEVPNGSNRVVVVEVRELPDANQTILYYGFSAPFALEVGKDTVAEVPIYLQVPETKQYDRHVELLFAGEPQDRIALAQASNATIRTRSVNSKTIVLDNRPSFDGNPTYLDLAGRGGLVCEQEPVPDADANYDLCTFGPWDLLAGLEGEPESGKLTVYAKFVDQNGYESPAIQASVNLDAQGPRVLAASLSNDVVKPGDSLLLTVSLDEAVAIDAVALSLTGAPSGVALDGPFRVGDSTTYQWFISVAESQASTESPVGFTVVLEDELGNPTPPAGDPALTLCTSYEAFACAAGSAPLQFAIDADKPELLNGAVIAFTPNEFGLSDHGYLLKFDLLFAEAHPLEIQVDESGYCEFFCPTVKIGGEPVSTLKPVESDDGMAFHATFVIDTALWPNLAFAPTIELAWSDRAGNDASGSVENRLYFDFQPPTALNCQLQPPVGNELSTFIYSVTASEPLATAPVLTVAAEQPLFEGTPSVSADGMTYTWTQPAAGLPSQSFAVSASLEDALGNQSVGIGPDSSTICHLDGAVDGSPPVLKDFAVRTNPEVANPNGGSPLLLVGQKGQIEIDLLVSEDNGMAPGSPSVVLAASGAAVPFQVTNEEVNGTDTAYVLSLDVGTLETPLPEGQWPIKVTLKDAAANLNTMDVLGGLLVGVDRTPPGASCAVVPEMAEGMPYGLATTATLQIAPLEYLTTESLPQIELQNQLGEALPGDTFAFVAGSKYHFAHTIDTLDGQGAWQLSVQLTDLVGNTTTKDPCKLDPLLIDALAPEILGGSVATLPQIPGPDGTTLPWVGGDGGTVNVTFAVVEGGTIAPGFPQVFLDVGGNPLSFAEVLALPGDNGTQYTFALEVPKELSLEGYWPVRVVAQDTAGNVATVPKLQDALVRVDFTPPSAQCSLIPVTGKPAGIGGGIVLQVTPLEPLYEGSLPALVALEGSDFTAEYLVYVEDTEYTFGHVVEDGESEGDFAYTVTLTDQAGNTNADACNGKAIAGSIDGTRPEASLVQVSVADGTDPEKPLRAGQVVQVDLSVTNSDVQPGVLLGGKPMAVASGPTGDGPFAWQFELELAKSMGDGPKALAVLGTDKAGNTFTLAQPQLVVADFTAPTAQCAIAPVSETPVGVGQVITLQVIPFEPLADGAPPLLVPTEDSDFDAAFLGHLSGTEFVFEHAVEQGDLEGSFAYSVTLVDEAGNINDDACGAINLAGQVDGIIPGVSLTEVSIADGSDPATPLRAGRQVLVDLSVTNTDSQPIVFLGKSAMAPVAGPAGSGPYQWQFALTMATEMGDGPKTLSVDVVDEANNLVTLTEPNLVVTDFTPPSAQCLVNIPTAKAGDDVRLSVLLSEPVQAIPDVATEPAVDGDGSTLLAYNQALSTPDAQSPSYVFEHVVAENEVVDWSAAVKAVDLAGNPVDGDILCGAAGAFDGKAISLLPGSLVEVFYLADGDWVSAGQFAQAGAHVVVEFGLDGIPADESLEVAVGGVPADLEAVDGDNYEYSFSVNALDGLKSGDVLPVTVSARDGAGNQTFATLGAVTTDFVAPSLASTPLFSRCDELTTARLANNSLWVNNAFACWYEANGESCNPGGDADTGPVQVTFSLAEPVALDTVLMSVDGQPLTLDLCHSSASFIQAVYQPSGDEAEETCRTVTASVVDKAGNSGALDLGCLYFDYQAPASPDTATGGAIVYSRMPWGSLATGHLKGYFLRGEAGALLGASEVYVYDQADSKPAAQIGKTVVNEDGSFGGEPGAESAFTIVSANQPFIYVQSRDLAGNFSDADGEKDGLQASLVRHGEWTISMKDKQRQSFVENPALFQTAGWFEYQMVQDDPLEAEAADGVGLLDEVALTTVGADLSWRKASPLDGFPAHRTNYGAAYDARRGRVVMYGGYKNSNLLSELWEWDGASWEEMLPEDPENDGSPPALTHPSMTWHGSLGRVVLYGGHPGGYGGPSNKLWAWDGTSWERINPTDPEEDGNPPGVQGSSFAWDSVRDRLVLFGGNTGSFYLGDVWEFDGHSWQKMTTVDDLGDGSPKNVIGSEMVFSPEHGRPLLIVGGYIDPFGDNNSSTSVWAWDGKEWELINTGQIPNRERFGDPVKDGHVYIFGGRGVDADGFCFPWCDSSERGDFWRLDGDTWVEVTSPDIAKDGDPGVRSGHKLVYDEGNGEFVLYGGQGYRQLNEPPYTTFRCEPKNNSSSCFRTWTWRDNEWIDRGPTSNGGKIGSPPARYAISLTYDPSRTRLVLYGGHGGGSALYEFNGLSWSAVTPTDVEGDGNPPYLFNHAGTYWGDSQSGEVFVFGGSYDANWSGSKQNKSWFFNGKRWLLAQLTDPEGDGNPQAVDYPAAAYDPLDNVVVMSGGASNSGKKNGTWLLHDHGNGSYSWELAATGGPGDKYGHSMVWDPTREVVVAFGGYSNQTYEWDGQQWTFLFPEDPEAPGLPKTRRDQALAAVPDRESVVLFGGRRNKGGDEYNDAWEWDGVTWERLEIADPDGDGMPTGRYGHGMALESWSGDLLMYGGSSNGDELWRGRWAGQTRPGHVFSVSLAEMGTCKEPLADGLAIEWHGGGTGSQPGARLMAWAGSGWEVVDEDVQALPDNILPLILAKGSAKEVSPYITGRGDQTLAVALVPIGTNGTEKATVATDYMEATVAYSITEDHVMACSQ